MRVALVALAALVALPAASRAADIPAKFRGVWTIAHSDVTKCFASAWKGQGRNDDDGLLKISAKSIEFYESGCDVKSVTTASQQAGINKSVDGPSTLTLSCSGEGETWTEREIWETVPISGAELLIATRTNGTSMSAYQRCN